MKPYLDDRADSGVGFFNFFGETGWFVHNGSDARAGNMFLDVNKFNKIKTSNGLLYRIHAGFFYNGFSSFQDQLNNLRPHYSTYTFLGLVNDDRGLGSYLEQTYCRDMKSASWDALRFSPLAPRVLPMRPCKRTHSMLEFFGTTPNQSSFLKFDYFANLPFDYKTDKAFLHSSLLGSQRFFK